MKVTIVNTGFTLDKLRKAKAILDHNAVTDYDKQRAILLALLKGRLT